MLIGAVLNLVLHGVVTVELRLEALLRVTIRLLIERFLEGVDSGERFHAFRISNNSARPLNETAIRLLLLVIGDGMVGSDAGLVAGVKSTG